MSTRIPSKGRSPDEGASKWLITRRLRNTAMVGYVLPVPMARGASAATSLGAEECMRPALIARRGLFVSAFVFLTLAVMPTSQAQTIDLTGRYQCAQAKVRGKVVPCTATPLTLKTDG